MFKNFSKNIPPFDKFASSCGTFLHLLTILLVLFGMCAPSTVASAAVPNNPGKTGELVDDTLQVPAEFRRMQTMSAASSNAPGYYDTSVYMIGRVAVGVVLPESNGAGENWTDAEINQVLGKIQEGTNQWVGWGGESAHLSFVFDVHTRVPTTHEPIQLASTDDYRWVNETLAALGFTAISSSETFTMYERLYQYANALRTQYQAQWAFVIYVVDSSTDPNGKFTDNRFGFAYYFGPMVVMTYDNGNWGINNMNWVTAHEIGHIFGAADQYNGACFGTTVQFGYLGVANSNCRGPVPSLMRDGGFYGPDETTRGQVGWLDSDADGLPNPVDTTISFDLSPSVPEIGQNSNLTYSGSIVDLPWPHATCSYCFGRDININAIIAVEFRIDNGVWQSASAGDGAFNSSSETFSFNAEGLAEGYHSIDMRASNSSGIILTWTDNVTIGNVPPFADVPAGYWAQDAILAISNAGITGGCAATPPRYCPGNSVTRAQMAVFILRAKYGAAYTPPPATGTIFGDVTDTGWFFSAWIEQLYSEGITGGCGGGNYCPNNPVTRAQMAVFLLRAKYGSAYIPPDGAGAIFGDVTDPNWFFTDWIEQFYNEGITGGCGGGNYCPEKPVTRDQMAVFLQRAFDLPLP